MSCAVEYWIALLSLMSYQSKLAVSPRTKLGRSTKPAVQVLAVSAPRLGLPPELPSRLEFAGENELSAGSKSASCCAVKPSPVSAAVQFAARYWVPSASRSG